MIASLLNTAAIAVFVLSRANPDSGNIGSVALIPSFNEWLIRRTALTTPDSMDRRALYQKIKSPMVLAHLLETEAQARELNGDPLGAAIRYDSLCEQVRFPRAILRHCSGRLLEYTNTLRV